MDSRAWVGLGHTYVEKKMYPEAVNAYGRSAALKNYTEVADLGHAYGRAGERDKALKALEELKQLSQREHVAPGAFAFIYTGLGDKDQAFEWLDKAYEERDTAWFPMIRVNPMSDPLRSDPRFQDLIRRLGL
jgi:tetratricopeptide (TPR) repeat protein